MIILMNYNEFVLDFFPISLLFWRIYNTTKAFTLWCQLEDMFQLIVTTQGIEKVMIQSKDTPTKVYAIGAELFSSKLPLEVFQN